MRDAVPPPAMAPPPREFLCCACQARNGLPIDDVEAAARAVATVLRALPADADDVEIDAGDNGAGGDRVVVKFRRSPFATPSPDAP